MSDYPSEEDLQAIRDWESIADADGWFRFVRSIWWAPEWGWHEDSVTDDLDRPVRRYSISTGGWSGNEDIIEAMGHNMLWHVTWQQSRRGGHYIFDVAVPEPVAGSPQMNQRSRR